jgi:outer membrane protein TolC
MLMLLCAYTPGQAQQVIFTQEQAIEMAIQTNPLLKSARARIDASKGRFWSGLSPAAPSFSISYEYVPIGGGLKHYGERTFEIAQEIEFPLNTYLKGKVLSREISLSELEYNVEKSSITTQVKTAYSTALAHQKLLEYSNQNLILAEDFARKSEIRFNEGEATYLERLTAKAQLTEAQNSLDIARNNLDIALNKLILAIGSGNDFAEKGLNLADSLKSDLLSASSGDLLADALQNNPLLQAQRLRVSLASSDRSLSWAGLLPSFRLSYYRQSQGSKSNYFGALFGVNLPLWFWLNPRGNIQESQANLSGAISESQVLINSITTAIKNAYLNCISGQRRLTMYQSDLLPQAEEIFRTATASYSAGEISYLEFLQSKQILVSARVNYTLALLNYNLSIIELEQILGGAPY